MKSVQLILYPFLTFSRQTDTDLKPIQIASVIDEAVSFSGKGIDPKIIKNIFDPFFTTKPVGEGTGLGLSVVHGIVRKMKGSINVYSNPEEGSSFTIILPAVDNASFISYESSLSEDCLRGNERILLIDDEQAIVNTLQTALESYGYSVRSFTNSEQALDEFRNNTDQYDIIITDQTMPRITGIELAIETRKFKKDIPVLLSTGYIDYRIELSAHQNGISHIIKKPATIQEIATSIRKMMNK